MKTHLIQANDPDCLSRALEILHSGGLVAFPTDTVYGVGALAFNQLSIMRLYEVKLRDRNRPLPILISDQTQLLQVTQGFTHVAQKLANQFWPGSLTIVVRIHPDLPKEVSNTGTVGVRIPDHAFARELLSKAGPMAVTSANLSGHDSPSRASDVLDELGGKIELVIDGGPTPDQRPSTVVDCIGESPILLREGPILFREILSVLP